MGHKKHEHHHKEMESKFNKSEYERARKDEKHHKRMEHLGEMGAAAAGAFAMHEKHQVKKDPEHAQRHKMQEKIAAAVAVGAHEHHKREESKKKAKEAHGKKHHHHLF